MWSVSSENDALCLEGGDGEFFLRGVKKKRNITILDSKQTKKKKRIRHTSRPVRLTWITTCAHNTFYLLFLFYLYFFNDSTLCLGDFSYSVKSCTGRLYFAADESRFENLRLGRWQNDPEGDVNKHEPQRQIVGHVWKGAAELKGD